MKYNPTVKGGACAVAVGFAYHDMFSVLAAISFTQLVYTDVSFKGPVASFVFCIAGKTFIENWDSKQSWLF